MHCNIGKTERVVRTVVGTGVVALGVVNNNYIADAVGAVILLSAAIGWCLPYAMFKINTTCSTKDKECTTKEGCCK